MLLGAGLVLVGGAVLYFAITGKKPWSTAALAKLPSVNPPRNQGVR